MTQLNLAAWDNLLRTYVNDQGLVAYERWQQDSPTELERWLTDMRDVVLQSLDRMQAIAFLLNLYNALTIQQVLYQYPINSIRPQILGIPNWLAFLQFFTRAVFTLSNQPLSLNTIEHAILRQQYPDPRMHFALVCASMGCPLLRAEAYVPDKLAGQLEEDCERFINNPNKVHYDAASQTLFCSKIFKWYKADFLTIANSIPTYIARYFNTQLPPSVAMVYLPYSWDLNQCISL